MHDTDSAPERSLTVMVPILNEEVLLPDFLAKTVADLESGNFDWELILIDDGSTDTSLEILRSFVQKSPRARLIALPRNVGPGANIVQAYQMASKRFVCYATVDGFFDTNLLPELVAHFIDHDAVSAYRTDLKAHSPRRRLQTILNEGLIRFLFPDRFVAYHTLQIHRTDFIHAIKLEARTPFLCSELLFKARALSLSIKEVGIPYLPRKAGKATGGDPTLIFRYLVDVFHFWFRWIFLRRPMVSSETTLAAHQSTNKSAIA